MPMIRNYSRSFRPSPVFASLDKPDKELVLTEVMVKNPQTKKMESQSVYMEKELSPIDPKLKGSDFSLKVQLQNGVNLTDCSKYFSPTLEQYDNMFKGLSNNLHAQQMAVIRENDLKQAKKDVQPNNPSES